MTRAGFLYSHAAHQVRHSAAVIAPLPAHPGLDVTALATSEMLMGRFARRSDRGGGVS